MVFAKRFLLSCGMLCVMAEAWSCNDAGATEQLEKVVLPDAVNNGAVCNDNTPAAYYFKKGSTPVWVVYLAGGGWCYDAESCKARESGSEYPHHNCSSSTVSKPCFMSNKNFPLTCKKTGIFDSDSCKNPLHNANKVYVPYCSSDGWMGNGDFAGWKFRGAVIARAVIQDIRNKGGLEHGDILVFGGGSAGGRGAMVLLDEIAQSLDGVHTFGFLDSPYYIDIAPFSGSGFAGFQHQHGEVLRNFNATSVLDTNAQRSMARRTGSACLDNTACRS